MGTEHLHDSVEGAEFTTVQIVVIKPFLSALFYNNCWVILNILRSYTVVSAAITFVRNLKYDSGVDSYLAVACKLFHLNYLALTEHPPYHYLDIFCPTCWCRYLTDWLINLSGWSWHWLHWSAVVLQNSLRFTNIDGIVRSSEKAKIISFIHHILVYPSWFN